MTVPVPFDPDWVVHPGAMLDEWMGTQETPWADAREHGIDPVTLYRLLCGEELIDGLMAEKLGGYTGISVEFWVNLERIFRDGLAVGKEWVR
jgi:plasmid maintenance system antidote protein VapI